MISVQELQGFCSDKKVYIWGAMIVGQGVCRCLERNGIRVEAFLDRSPSHQGKKALGYAILNPNDVLESVRNGEGVIITGSGHNSLEIAATCEERGLVKDRDFILCSELNDLDPSVDVAGMCNLRCISCPRGNEAEQPPAGFMSAATYRLVLAKLLREIPLLGSIQLYTWGEPLLNQELPEIIRITRDAKVLIAISSNLNYARNMEEVIAARPDWFKVSCSGWGESYEMTHTGGKWQTFLSNLRQLAALRDRCHPDMQIVLNYHLYKHNIGEDYRRIEALCNELSLIFIPSHAYLYPLDWVMDYADGKKLSSQARETLPMLLMDIDEGIRKARERIMIPCSEERCLPINWDCRVRTCGVFFRNFIPGNFLDTPLDELLKQMRTSTLCHDCKERGIQHFTSVYLAESHISPETN